MTTRIMREAYHPVAPFALRRSTEDPTEVDQEVDMSRNRVDFLTDERGVH